MRAAQQLSQTASITDFIIIFAMIAIAYTIFTIIEQKGIKNAANHNIAIIKTHAKTQHKKFKKIAKVFHN